MAAFTWRALGRAIPQIFLRYRKMVVIICLEFGFFVSGKVTFSRRTWLLRRRPANTNIAQVWIRYGVTEQSGESSRIAP